MLARLLVLILLGGLIYLLLGRWRRARGAQAQKQPRQDKVANMVACAHCGVHLPESEALIADGQAYCCAAHRQHGPPRP